MGITILTGCCAPMIFSNFSAAGVEHNNRFCKHEIETKYLQRRSRKKKRCQESVFKTVLPWEVNVRPIQTRTKVPTMVGFLGEFITTDDYRLSGQSGGSGKILLFNSTAF